MKSVRIKYAICAAIATLMVVAVPLVGFTESSADGKQGLVLDFGYWDMEWTEMVFTEGMTGYDALERVCEWKGYECNILEDGTVYSVNEQYNLVGIEWGFYIIEDGLWVDADPSMEISDVRIVSWARCSGVDAMVPGSDCDGFTYYGYAKDGRDAVTGKQLRIVTLAPSVTETVTAVGGIDYIVGCDLYSDYPQEVQDRKEDGTITVTGGYTDPNFEWIVKLEPDIVFCDGGTGQHVTMADKLRKAGIDCVVLSDAVDISAMYDNLWITASALGLSENANSVISALSKTINDVSGIAGDTNKRVFAALSTDPSPWTSGNRTFMSDIIYNAGGRNIFDGQGSGWFMVSKEQVYAKQPQVIIIIGAAPVTDEEAYAAILESLDPVWKATPAYENGEVYVFSGDAGDILSRPGPRLSEATELMAKILNPEAFLDRDPLDSIPKYFADDYRYYLKYQVDPTLMDVGDGEGEP